jgi:hypothetical protein
VSSAPLAARSPLESRLVVDRAAWRAFVRPEALDERRFV